MSARAVAVLALGLASASAAPPPVAAGVEVLLAGVPAPAGGPGADGDAVEHFHAARSDAAGDGVRDGGEALRFARFNAAGEGARGGGEALLSARSNAAGDGASDGGELFDSARSGAAGTVAPDGIEPFASAGSDAAGDAAAPRGAADRRPDGGLADAATAGGGPDAGGWAVALTPVAAPAYTPELGFLFAAGGVLSWNGDPARPDIPRSSATLIAGAGTVGAFLGQVRVASFWRADTVRAALTLDVRDMPDHSFGVGFENGLTRPQGDATTLYRRTWWQVTPAFLFRVFGPVFVGTTFDFTGTLTRDESAGVRADPDFQRGGPRVVNSGWGATLSIDTRDVPVNAWRGVYLAATWLGYAPWAGATTQWQAFNLDYRQYVTLGRPGSTLAWQVKYRTAWGEVPWSDLSQLGTPWDLRAYRWGRYRDRTALSAVVEYRFMLPFAPTSFFSRFGLAGWLGVGALGEGPVPDVLHLLPAAGVGARFDVQTRITLRLDFGFGRESRAVYLNFLEAF
ncbi:MAG: hypothetical protein AB1730_00620 [Myxococcota bacterium]